jgi:hypothetical protein
MKESTNPVPRFGCFSPADFGLGRGNRGRDDNPAFVSDDMAVRSRRPGPIDRNSPAGRRWGGQPERGLPIARRCLGNDGSAFRFGYSRVSFRFHVSPLRRVVARRRDRGLAPVRSDLAALFGRPDGRRIILVPRLFILAAPVAAARSGSSGSGGAEPIAAGWGGDATGGSSERPGMIGDAIGAGT